MKQAISFVIPSYRSEATLSHCLQSIYLQKTDHPFEIIVVDSSGNDLEGQFSARFPRVRWMLSDLRLTPGAARNRGLALAQAPLVAFLDSDVVLDPDWISRSIEFWDDSHAALLGHLRPWPEPNLLGWCLFVIQFSLYFPGTEEKELSKAASYAILTRTEDARRAGGFPEEYPVLEDYGFSRRLIKYTGKTIHFHPAVGACHINKRGWRLFSSQLRYHGEWAARVRRQPDFPGHFLTRYSWLVLGLPWYRYLVTGYRTMRWGGGALFRYLLYSPVIALGFWIWAWAFFRQSLRRVGNPEI